MDVLVPIAAEDPEFDAHGYDVPKPLIDLRGQPMIKWAMSSVEWVDPSSYIFPVLETHIAEYAIDDRLRELFGPRIEIVPIDGMTDGAARTALRAKHHLSDEELIVLFGDQYIRAPVQSKVRHTDADGMIPVFNSSDPRWSYAKTTDQGVVTKVAEKRVISSNATVGLYYFNSGTDFVEGAEQMIQKDVRTGGFFYVCPVYNELIKMDKRIEISTVDEMWSFDTPTDVRSFEENFEED
jgi:dTDP-glucose pyrophosphorylase